MLKSKVPEKELFVVMNYLVILDETVNSLIIVKCIEYNFWIFYYIAQNIFPEMSAILFTI